MAWVASRNKWVTREEPYSQPFYPVSGSAWQRQRWAWSRCSLWEIPNPAPYSNCSGLTLPGHSTHTGLHLAICIGMG